MFFDVIADNASSKTKTKNKDFFHLTGFIFFNVHNVCLHSYFFFSQAQMFTSIYLSIYLSTREDLNIFL